MFFFEKKNQKTLDYGSRAGPTGAVPRDKSFLLLFFKKEVLAFLVFRILVPSAEGAISVIDAPADGSFAVHPPLAADPGVRAAAFDEQSGRLYLVRSVAGALSLAMVDLSP
jgi:hypothetical protein